MKKKPNRILGQIFTFSPLVGIFYASLLHLSPVQHQILDFGCDSRFWALFGVIRPVRYDPPPPSGDYDHALHIDHPEAPSFLDQYMPKPEPRLGGTPKKTEPAPPDFE